MTDAEQRIKAYFNAKSLIALEKKTGKYFTTDKGIRKYCENTGILEDIFKEGDFAIGIEAIFERLMDTYKVDNIKELSKAMKIDEYRLTELKNGKEVKKLKDITKKLKIYNKIFGYKHFQELVLPNKTVVQINQELKYFYSLTRELDIAELLNIGVWRYRNYLFRNQLDKFIRFLYEYDLKDAIEIAYDTTGKFSVPNQPETTPCRIPKTIVQTAKEPQILGNMNTDKQIIKNQEEKSMKTKIRNVIENKQRTTLTLKVILDTPEDAKKFCDEVIDIEEKNQADLQKLKIALGLTKFDVNDVFSYVLITYEFKDEKDCKHFAVSFSEEINNDYNNLLDILFIHEKREVKEKSTYIITLNLPQDSLKAFEIDDISSIALKAYPTIKITRELVAFNGKEVHLIVDDFSNELISIKLTKAGDTFFLPQKWFNIEDRGIEGIYDTKWVFENFLGCKDDILIASKNEQVIEVSAELVKKDGVMSKFVHHNGMYMDLETNISVPKEIVLLSVA